MQLRPTTAVATVAALGLLAGAGAAHAEPDRGRGIDAQLYRPALDGSGLLGLEGSQGVGRYRFQLHLGTSFARAPLALDTLPDAQGDLDGQPDDVIDQTLAVNFGFAFGVSDRLTLGVEVPVDLQPLGSGFGVDGRYAPLSPDDPLAQPGTGFYSTRDESNAPPAENVPGDLRVGLKLRLPARLALQVVGWLPFGDEDVFAGSAGATLEPRLIWDLPLGARGLLVFNLAARLRRGVLAEVRQVNPNGTIRNDAMGQPVYLPRLYVGSEALVGVGAHARLGEHLRVVGEATLLVPLDHAGAALCPEAARCKDGDLTGEALVGVGFGAGQLSFTLAGGTGIVPDAARGPAFRVIGALAWTPLPRSVTARVDDDGDRIPGGVDICPDEPEDGDGFQDDDGCPDLDNDLDGVLDATDRCADEPEDRDAFQDEDGCAEGDNDGDGVADSTDLCPTIGEDRDGHADDDGCPDEDNDGDGVLDARDKCRDEAETVNGYDDLDGCPDQAVQGGPRLGATAIDLQGERIEFVGATDQLTRASKATLDGVAEVMRKNPRVRFRVEVGVEQTGKKRRDLDADQRLTERRAEAVRAYLQAQGVPVAQLDIAGLGSTRPIDADPRSVKNRRVEFIRLNQ